MPGRCALGGRYVLRRRSYRHRDLIPAPSLSRRQLSSLGCTSLRSGLSVCGRLKTLSMEELNLTEACTSAAVSESVTSTILATAYVAVSDAKAVLCFEICVAFSASVRTPSMQVALKAKRIFCASQLMTPQGLPEVISWSIRVHPTRQIISRPPPSARDRSYRLISRLRRR